MAPPLGVALCLLICNLLPTTALWLAATIWRWTLQPIPMLLHKLTSHLRVWHHHAWALHRHGEALKYVFDGCRLSAQAYGIQSPGGGPRLRVVDRLADCLASCGSGHTQYARLGAYACQGKQCIRGDAVPSPACPVGSQLAPCHGAHGRYGANTRGPLCYIGGTHRWSMLFSPYFHLSCWQRHTTADTSVGWSATL